MSRCKYKALELEKINLYDFKEDTKRCDDIAINCMELLKDIVNLEFGDSKHDIVLDCLSRLEKAKKQFEQEKEKHLQEYKNKIAAIEQEQAQIKVKIDSIEDNLIREAFKIKYIEGGSWEQIAKKIGYSLTHTYRLIDYWCRSTDNAAIKEFIE